MYLLKYSTDGSKAIFSILGWNYDADKISNVWPMSVAIVMEQHSLLYLQTETLYFSSQCVSMTNNICYSRW